MCQLEEIIASYTAVLPGRWKEEPQGFAGPQLLCDVLSSCSTGLHSPPLLGTAAMPGLVAPISNGFTGVVPFPNGHPTLETVYTNGLVPYSGMERGKNPNIQRPQELLLAPLFWSPHREHFQAPYLPGTETHLAVGWGVGGERHREHE